MATGTVSRLSLRFSAVTTISAIPLSSLGEIYGYRRIYQAGLVLFTLASLACALSNSLPTLTVARVVQGFGAAGMMSVNSALVRFIYPRHLLGRGFGVNVMVGSASSALGPTIAAAAYKKNFGQPFMYPQNNLDSCSNLLHMMFAVPAETSFAAVTEEVGRRLNGDRVTAMTRVLGRRRLLLSAVAEGAGDVEADLPGTRGHEPDGAGVEAGVVG